MSETPASYGSTLRFEPLPDEEPSGDEFGDLYAQLGIDPEAGEYNKLDIDQWHVSLRFRD